MTDTMMTLRQARVELASELELIRHLEDRIDLVAWTCIETGGCLVRPSMARGWGPHIAELHLLGVLGQGDDIEAAIASWCASVHRIEREAQAEDLAREDAA